MKACGTGHGKKILRGLLLPAALLVIWQAAAASHILNRYIIPAPEDVWQAVHTLWQSGALFRHVQVSLLRVAAGFVLTFAAAFPLAVLVGTRRGLIDYLEPLLEFIRHIPPIACIPILILWFGIEETPKLAVIFLATFFPVFLNTLQGIVHCDPKLVEVGDVFGFTLKDKLLRIILPAAMPSIIVGMRLGLGYSWRSLIGAELIAASSGIGYMIMDAEQLSRPDIVLVGILAIGCVGCVMDYSFFWLTHRWLQGHSAEVDYGRN